MPAGPEFSVILDRLRDIIKPFPAVGLHRFSDLAGHDLAALEALWPQLPVERRRGVIQDLSEIGEANFEVSFEAVFRLGLEDEDAEVRATAIRALWEVEEPDLIAPLLDFLQHDPDVNVRAAAAGALGRYVYLGELDKLPAPQAGRLQQILLNVIHGADEPEVRRRALEAVAYSGRPEIPPLISEAYASSDHKFRISALFAMGRSADPRWAPQVRAELSSPSPELRFEAARAAGELQLTDAAKELSELIYDGDPQVREAAIWSLGQVGGDLARETLTRLLDEEEDEEEQDFIRDAIDTLDFTDEVQPFSTFALGEEDQDDRSRLN